MSTVVVKPRRGEDVNQKSVARILPADKEMVDAEGGEEGPEM